MRRRMRVKRAEIPTQGELAKCTSGHPWCQRRKQLSRVEFFPLADRPAIDVGLADGVVL